MALFAVRKKIDNFVDMVINLDCRSAPVVLLSTSVHSVPERRDVEKKAIMLLSDEEL